MRKVPFPMSRNLKCDCQSIGIMASLTTKTCTPIQFHYVHVSLYRCDFAVNPLCLLFQSCYFVYHFVNTRLGLSILELVQKDFCIYTQPVSRKIRSTIFSLKIFKK